MKAFREGLQSRLAANLARSREIARPWEHVDAHGRTPRKQQPKQASEFERHEADSDVELVAQIICSRPEPLRWMQSVWTRMLCTCRCTCRPRASAQKRFKYADTSFANSSFAKLYDASESPNEEGVWARRGMEQAGTRVPDVVAQARELQKQRRKKQGKHTDSTEAATTRKSV